MPAEAAPSFLCVPELAEREAVLELPPEEHRYLFRVCRARDGEEATATDGRGGLARLVVEGVGPKGRVRVIEVSHEDRAAGCWICCGAPEGTRADWLVEKLAELGVERLQPIDTDRARWSAGQGRVARWERLASAALRQSRQVWRLEVSAPVSVESLDGLVPRAGRLLADGRGAAMGPPGGACPGAAAVGPAGGWTVSEREHLIETGWRPTRLAPAVLRTETAALSVAALWAAGWGVDRSRGRT